MSLLRSTASLLSLLFLLFPSSALAAEAPAPATPGASSRFELAVSSGVVGVPAMGNWLVLTPLAAEIGYFPDRRFEITLGFEYGQSNGLTCTQCDGWRARGTVRGRIHIAPGAVFDPWVGGGFGYEVLHVPGLAYDPRTFGGIELPTLATGADVRLFAGLRAGVAVEADLVWRNPAEAPAWSVGEGQWPVQVTALARVACAF